MAGSVAVDTSVVVAALLTWHEHHAVARQALEAAMGTPPLVLPVAVLVESYSVMTRLPPPHRLSPADAHALLRRNFATSARVEGLSGAGCWSLLAALAAEGIAGGRTYDAHIAACAVKGRASVLLTLNVADFVSVAGNRIEIRSPLLT